MRYLTALLLVLVVIGGCSSPSASAQVSAAASAQAGAVTLVCGSIAALKVSVDTFRSLDPATTSQDTYAAALDGIRGAWTAVQNNLARLTSTNAQLVQTSYQALSQAWQAQPTGASVTTSLTAVKPEAQQLADALTQVNSGLNCPPIPTPTAS